jgi:phosphatidylserine/phosphatidylglycerophosphate/cardiolipin synthase-like enzyme
MKYSVRMALCFLALFLCPSLFGCAIVPTTSIYSTPNQPISVNENQLQLYFPRIGQNPVPVLVGLFGQARSSVDVASYSLTHPDIVSAMIAVKKRSVPIRIITDKVQSAGSAQKHAMNALIDAGVPIKVETHSGLMHLKMSIIDGIVATTGSYNYTKGATDDNDEMFVVVTEPGFVSSCQREFNRLWSNPGFVDLRIQ